MKELAYSMCGEYYSSVKNTDDISKIIKDLIDNMELDYYFEEDGYAVVHIGEINNYKDKGSDAYSDVIDGMFERALDEGGEFAEFYLDSIDEKSKEFLKNELDILWEKFLDMSGHRNPFFHVYNAKKYKVLPSGEYEEINEEE
ncbi:MAG: hypothetical protein ACRDDY_03540 [Clostridium sp.]|uniref:hypothetical protein n=1 Tax=Clostridium sp. TaxID=1506 RepID=UPI003EE63890